MNIEVLREAAQEILLATDLLDRHLDVVILCLEDDLPPPHEAIVKAEECIAILRQSFDKLEQEMSHAQTTSREPTQTGD